MKKPEKLFEQFPGVTTAKWMEKIRADLKGADFNEKLVWHTGEGLDIMPFYRQEDIEDLKYIDSLPGEFPFIRGKKSNGNSWKIRQNITVRDYRKANRKALEILQRGVDSVGFYFTDPSSIHETNFDLLLKDIVPEAVELNFLSDGRASEMADIFINYLVKTGADLKQITGAIEADPLSRLMINGTLCIPVDKSFEYLANVAGKLLSLTGFRAIHINASNFSNAGTDIVKQLAFAISMGTEYISRLGERGIKAETAASKIRFSFGIGSDYFPEIARLRAARLLWSAIMRKYQPDSDIVPGMEIHCMTSEWNKTLYDNHVNMLRTQTEAMAAILGGADSLTVEPYDIVFRDPDDFSERIARNQQLILKEESYFDKVADPAAGSYYIESLTKKIAEAAWDLFLEIEDKGGFLESLRKGCIQELVKKSAEIRKTEISKRGKIFLGTNRYANQEEIAPENADSGKVSGVKTPAGNSDVEPIRLFRGPEDLERIRLQVEKAKKRPVVFLLTVGNSGMRRARAQFSSDFFGCAGYRVIDNPGFGSVEEGSAEALKSGADIVVICSSDNEYAMYAPAAFDKISGKALFVVAGNPASLEELKLKGIEHFISLRSDVAESLEHFNEMMGI